VDSLLKIEYYITNKEMMKLYNDTALKLIMRLLAFESFKVSFLSALLHNSCVVLWSVPHVPPNLMILADVVLCMLVRSTH
jgi:hypothetical protein